MLVGVATTNSSEDDLGRVRVECAALWEEESSLLPVLNNVFISKGDAVVLFSPENLQQSLFVLGKFQTKAVQESDPIDTKGSPVLFKAHVGDSFVIGTVTEETLHIETDKGLKIDLTSDSVSYDVPKDYDIKADSVSVESSKETHIDASKVVINGGSNRGVVNIAQIESLVQALAADMLVAMSGANLATWMSSQMSLMEDKNFTH